LVDPNASTCIASIIGADETDEKTSGQPTLPMGEFAYTYTKGCEP